MRAQALGDREAARLADGHVARGHERGHVVHVVEHGDVAHFQLGALLSQVARVVGIAARHEHEVQRLLEAVQVGQKLVECGAEVDIGAGQVGARQREHDELVLGESEPLARGRAVVGSAEVLARGNAGDEDALLGHLARAQRLGHRLVRHAEQIGGQVRPEPFGLVVGGHAHDGEVLAGEHARRHRHVRGGDVGAHDGEGLALSDELREGGVHDAVPYGAAAPQKASGEREAPGEIVDGPCGSREQRRGLVPVEHDAPEVEHVEHLHLEVLREGRRGVGAFGSEIGCRELVAQQVEGLRDGVRRAAVPGAHRGVHDDDRRAGRVRRFVVGAGRAAGRRRGGLRALRTGAGRGFAGALRLVAFQGGGVRRGVLDGVVLVWIHSGYDTAADGVGCRLRFAARKNRLQCRAGFAIMFRLLFQRETQAKSP